MNLLLDTHVLLWAAAMPERLSASARTMLDAPEHTLLFSTASIWEVAIKSGLGRDDFEADAGLLRRGLLDNGYEELAITSTHAIATSDLPPIHRDPFDRVLIAQARVEGALLLTADEAIAGYPGSIQKI